jgi:surface glycoprotein (TIGR04207 family)
MTSKTNEFRALFLAALMIVSVVGATFAFAGTAAATVAPNSLDLGSGDNTRHFAQSGTDLTDIQVDLGTTAQNVHVFIDENSNGAFDSGEANVTTATPLESLSNAGLNDLSIPSRLSEGDYTVIAHQINVGIREMSGTLDDSETLTILDGTLPTVIEAIAHDAGGGQSIDTIEVAFNQSVFKNDSASLGSLNSLDFNNVSVFVDDSEVSVSSATAASSDGSLDITLSNPIAATADAKVVFTALQNGVGNSATPANVTVNVAGQSFQETADFEGSADDDTEGAVFAGTVVAFETDTVGNNADLEINTQAGTFVFDGSTGTNSDVFLFDTSGRNISATYDFTLDGGTAPTSTLISVSWA